jgi:hypothetical protein
MKKEQNNNKVTKEQESTVVLKKAYEKPQVVYSAPLEAVAGVCNPDGTGTGKTVGVGCSTTFS